MKITKIFTFLKENNILVDIKTKLIKVIGHEKENLETKLKVFLADKSPKVKNAFINYLMSKIQLPFYLKPFKGLVKKVLTKNINRVVEFIVSNL